MSSVLDISYHKEPFGACQVSFTLGTITLYKLTMKKSEKRYTIQFIAAMLAYVVVLLVCVVLLKQFPDSWIRIPLAVAPLIPVIFGLYAFLRKLSLLDELQTRIQYEAITFGSLATALLTFAYGFLELVGLPRLSMTLVLPLLGFLWGVGLFVAKRRYK